MKRKTNARVAGATFLLYIVAGIASMVLYGRASSGTDVAARLATIGQHPAAIGVVVLLGLIQAFCALVLAVTLHAITREEDPDLAMLGLVSRVGEGLIGISIPAASALLWLAVTRGADAPDTSSAHGLAAFLFRLGGWHSLITATFFAVGSTFFSALLVRGRLIPIPLGWLGVFASLLLVILLPLQLAGFVHGMITNLVWLPMLLFEVPLAFWLLVKGVGNPVREAL